MNTWMNINFQNCDAYKKEIGYYSETHQSISGSLSDVQKTEMRGTHAMMRYVMDNYNKPGRFNADLNTKDMRV